MPRWIRYPRHPYMLHLLSQHRTQPNTNLQRPEPLKPLRRSRASSQPLACASATSPGCLGATNSSKKPPHCSPSSNNANTTPISAHHPTPPPPTSGPLQPTPTTPLFHPPSLLPPLLQ